MTLREQINGKASLYSTILSIFGMCTAAIVYAENTYLKESDLKTVQVQVVSVAKKMDRLIVMNQITAISLQIYNIEQKISQLEARDNLSQADRQSRAALRQERERMLITLNNLQTQ